MDNVEQYIISALEKQEQLIKSLAIAMAQHYAIDADFQIEVSSPQAKTDEEAYKINFIAISNARLKAVDGKGIEEWEAILENIDVGVAFAQHPYVKAFNKIAESKAVSARIHDTGPKDYCMAKIKAVRVFNGDLTKIDDTNRIMVEIDNPHATQLISKILAKTDTAADVPHIEKRVMQGFVSDVYKLEFKDQSSAEIAFVPCGLVASSSVTHGALRFRRASKFIKDDSLRAAFYKATCKSIKEKFNVVSKNINVDKKLVDVLDMKEFNLDDANNRLKTFETNLLEAVLNKPENNRWRAFLGR